MHNIAPEIAQSTTLNFANTRACNLDNKKSIGNHREIAYSKQMISG